ncbi:MAG: cyclodeaminase/cyclohydrolase family protein [Streptosporangiaceae bacterium]
MGPEPDRAAVRVPAGYAGLPVGEFLDALAAGAPAPAAGSAAAVVLALAAALCAKSARLSARQLGAGKAAELTAAAERVRAAATALIDADAWAYQAVIAAGRAGPGGEADNRAAALSRAADVPMQIAALAADLAGTAARLATAGNPNLRGDAHTAALLAQAAARSAARLVAINLADAPGDPRPARAAHLVARIAGLAAAAGPAS